MGLFDDDDDYLYKYSERTSLLSKNNIASYKTNTSIPTTTPWEEVLYAAQEGNLEIVKTYISANKADEKLINKQDELGFTLLAVAAVNGHKDIVSALIDAGADPTIQNKNKVSPILLATKSGKTEVMVELITHGKVNVNTMDSNQETPLQLAARYKQITALNKLIELKADPNIPYPGNKLTALHRAAAFGQIDIVKILIESGAKVNPLSTDGDSPMVYAASSGYTDVVEALIEKGAHEQPHKKPVELWRNEKTYSGKIATIGDDALMHAIYPVTLVNKNMLSRVATNEDRHQTIALLLKKGAKVPEWAMNEALVTALQDVAKLNTIPEKEHTYIKTLVEQGAQVEKIFSQHKDVRTFEGVQQLIIQLELIEPKVLTPETRAQILESMPEIAQDTPKNDLKTNALLKALVTSELPSRSTYVTEPLVEFLLARGVTMKYEELKELPHLHKLSSFLGFGQLCKLANVEVGSANSYRLYAQINHCELRAKCNNKPDEATNKKVWAWDKVVETRDDMNAIIKTIEAASKAEHPFSSRIYTRDPASDMPKELGDHFKTQKQSEQQKMSSPIQSKQNKF